MIDFFQNTLDGIFIGSSYALLAIGFTLIFGIMRRMNLAYGPSIMVGIFAGTLLYVELQAGLVALENLRGYPRAMIYTDSRYLIDGVTKWIHNWRRRAWVTTSGTPVKNRALWQRLAALNHAGITWRHVYGHTGDPNNERVDDIARAFASGTAPVLFHGLAGASDDPVEEIGHQPATKSSRGKTSRSTRNAQYISIVHGTVAIDDEWAACAVRVQGVSGAKYKKVRTPQELAEFCAKHGIDIPPES